MMRWTDRHCRYFHRLLAPHARLYTEMVSTDALLRGPRARLLRHSVREHPVALQLGGADPVDLSAAARLGADAGFDEINLNVGCPSDRVQNARIGACLMREAEHVADCVAAMRSAVEIPVTVKCRTGVDDCDDYEFLRHFVGTVADAGCQVFIVHARKALLSGLSPAQNRRIPPLDWTRVEALKRDFSALTIVGNGGLHSTAAAVSRCRQLDGIMVGRAAYQNPWLLTELDAALCGSTPPASRKKILTQLFEYLNAELQDGTRFHDMTRHLLGLFNGQPGARQYRRVLSEQAYRHGAGMNVLHDATARVFEVTNEEALARCSNG
jgi:tRNA-dihydrouridine synthase A